MLKSQSISFQLFKILPIQKRMDLAQSPDAGASLLSALTPTQFAELFPKYYQRALPDVEGFQLAVTKRTREQQQKADGQLQERLASLESTNSELRQGMEKLGVARAKELPKLSPEQEAAYNTIRTADVPVNSEQGKMFASLDNEKLASVGITKTKNEKGEDAAADFMESAMGISQSFIAEESCPTCEEMMEPCDACKSHAEEMKAADDTESN